MLNPARQAGLARHEAGQALLIVLLSMAVVLTIVLSIFSNSVTDIAVTTSEAESLRAFSAAEAGIEKALIALTAQSGSFGEDLFQTSVTNFAEGLTSFVYPVDLASGDDAVLWLVSHNANDDLSCADSAKPCFRGSKVAVCWGRAGTPSNSATTPAIEASVYYSSPPVSGSNYGGVVVAREVSDPNSTRRTTNKFTAPDAGGCTIDGKAFAFKKILDFSTLGIPASSYSNQNGLQFAQVRMIYNTDTSQTIGFDAKIVGAGNTPFPSQGRQILSQGTAGEATRKVEVYRLYGSIASSMSASIFSGGSLSK
ncbi:MAG: hypothetical protein AAB656_03380 [Patescibacteria group bacterium]